MNMEVSGGVRTGDVTSKMDNATRRKQLIAASIGNVLEFYDFVIYAYLATTIAVKFFPSENETASLLATFAAFGVGFLARPLGGFIFGKIGDARGRKPALLMTIFAMAIGTVGIGLLPTYETIGIAAPILIVVMRLLQGLAAGGEWGGATAFIAESAPPGRRGLYGSIGQASNAAAGVVSNLVVALTYFLIPAQDMLDWGWRIPFLIGGILLPVGLLLRKNMHEAPAFVESQKKPQTTPVEMGSKLSMMAKAFGFTIVWTVSFYVLLNYMPTFLQKHVGLSQSQSFWINCVNYTLITLMMPLFGYWSDKAGRKPFLLACCLAMIVLPYFMFSVLVSHPSTLTIIGALMVGNIFIAAFSGAGPAALAELFPTHSRTTLMSTSYSLATAIFGGFAPFIATWLISTTGSPISPTFYVMAAGVISGLTIMTFRETAHQALR